MVTTLPVGDAHCPNGGAVITVGTSSTYVCSSTPVQDPNQLIGSQARLLGQGWLVEHGMFEQVPASLHNPQLQ